MLSKQTQIHTNHFFILFVLSERLTERLLLSSRHEHVVRYEACETKKDLGGSSGLKTGYKFVYISKEKKKN